MNQVDSFKNWMEFMKPLLAPSIDGKTGEAFFKYLADLGLFDHKGEDQWELLLSNDNVKSVSLVEAVHSFFIERAKTKEGFGVAFFLVEPDSYPDISAGVETDNSATDDTLSSPSSNLSNLQLVKKMGKQLSPFIELEAKLNKVFLGKYVSKKDARILTNFVISVLKEKETPRQWEQLSRKRHK